ncbi:uncharacterized protein K02A2.6-like [Dermacentor silvarum]|uniref:uncharacterized protein K02A2.6-like n=1 Tax=Dermacentor silvarum TaxID=543639 RepID=UPI00210173CF|nr:uncharacterized protein K02A2.6-like [Dermacentor silvarum]
MEVNSGAVCSVVNERTLRRLRVSKHKLQHCDLQLRTYNQQQLKVLGSVTVQVNYRGRQEQLRLVVVKRAGVNLLGRDWFKALGIELKVNQLRMDKVSQSPSLTSVLKKHSKVFQPGLGKSQGPPVRVEVQPHAQPRFYKPRPVPFALLPRVDEALIKLIGQGRVFPTFRIAWDAHRITQCTRSDPTLARVQRWVVNAWPHGKLEEEFKPFVRRQHELSEYRGCLLWGCRAVVPNQARSHVLELLHSTHPGIVRMKALARSTVWWPGIDGDIEKKVRACQRCQETRPEPPRARLHPWEYAKNPWSRIHIDFAGPFQGTVFLLVVDAHSKWLKVFPLKSMSSATVCRKLRALFAVHGVPDTVVSDNGTAFCSEEFQVFMRDNQIRHVRVAPYHPSSNGQVERMVQETKQVLRRMSGGDMDTKLARFLLSQHVLPHSTTGKSPAEMLMGRRLHTALDKLHPDLLGEMMDKQKKLSQQSNPESAIL